jgi:hypothetical protein
MSLVSTRGPDGRRWTQGGDHAVVLIRQAHALRLVCEWGGLLLSAVVHHPCPWANRPCVRLVSMGDAASAADEMLPVMRETELQALPWLRSVLGMAAAGRIRCSDKTKRPTAASVAELAKVLTGGDFYSDIPMPCRRT